MAGVASGVVAARAGRIRGVPHCVYIYILIIIYDYIGLYMYDAWGLLVEGRCRVRHPGGSDNAALRRTSRPTSTTSNLVRPRTLRTWSVGEWLASVS